jgi:hypothetical protein
MSLEPVTEGWTIDDEGEGRPASSTGRTSTSMNDDDFDYALELCPDEEYRRVAEVVPSVVDFNDLLVLRRNRDKLSSSSSLFPSMSTEENRQDRDSDDEQFVDDLEGNHEIGVANGALRVVWNGILRRLRAGSEKLKCEDQSLSNTSQTAACSFQEVPFRHRLDNQSSPGTDIETGQSIGMINVASPTVHRRRSPLKQQPQQQPQHISPSIDNCADDSPQSTPSKCISPAVVVSEEQFVAGMAHLSKRQRWVQASSRRSSIAFLREQGFLSKSASDRLTVALVSGLVVKRHQAHKHAEYVRLYSIDGISILKLCYIYT